MYVLITVDLTFIFKENKSQGQTSLSQNWICTFSQMIELAQNQIAQLS